MGEKGPPAPGLSGLPIVSGVDAAVITEHGEFGCTSGDRDTRRQRKKGNQDTELYPFLNTVHTLLALQCSWEEKR